MSLVTNGPLLVPDGYRDKGVYASAFTAANSEPAPVPAPRPLTDVGVSEEARPGSKVTLSCTPCGAPATISVLFRGPNSAVGAVVVRFCDRIGAVVPGAA